MDPQCDDQHSPAGPIWDEATARWYVQNYGDHPTNRKTVELADLRQDDRVLDIGCGSGPAVRIAAGIVTKGGVTGVDPTPAMVHMAKELIADSPHAGRITYLKGSAEKLPVPDAAFTVAWAINSANHWHDLAQGLAEAYRVLEPAGRFLVADEWFPDTVETDDGMNMDPALIATAMANAGFVNVSVSTNSIGSEMMSLVEGQKPVTRPE